MAREEDNNFSDITFRQGMTELDSIVGLLESGTLELEDSLKEYSRGVALLAEMQKRLSNAEQQVEVLMGELEDAPDDSVQDSTLSKA